MKTEGGPFNFEGIFRGYYENGNLKEEGYYQDGKKKNLWKYYSEDGKIIKEEVF